MEPASLDYRRRPLPTSFDIWLGRRMPRWLVIVSICFWTWPFLLTAFWLAPLSQRPLFHVVIGGGLGWLVCAALMCRTARRRALYASFGIKPESDEGRTKWIVVGSVIIVILHALAVPHTVMFWCHKPWFDAEVRRVQRTMPPYDELHGVSVGIYDFDKIITAPGGAVAFYDSGDGGFEYTPPGVRYGVIIPNRSNSGPFGSGWQWVIQD